MLLDSPSRRTRRSWRWTRRGRRAPPLPTITLDSSNWSAGATIDVTAIDDLDLEGPHTGMLSFTVDPSSDPSYASLGAAPISFTIADNDVPTIVCTRASRNWFEVPDANPVSEDPTASDHTASCQVELNGTSTADTVVTIAVSDPAQLNAPRSVTIPAGSRGPVPIVFTAVDDGSDEAEIHSVDLTFTVANASPLFAGLSLPTRVFDISDNDQAAVIVTPDTPIALAEGGATGTFTTRLGSQPSADVVITTDAGPQAVSAPGAITFTAANWRVERTVTVTAIDDDLVEANPHAGVMTFGLTSSDATYAALTPADINGGTQANTSPAQITFAPTAWATAQTITVTAVQDSIAEANPHVGEIKHELTTSSDGWAGANVASVNAQIADDDTAAVVVTQTDDATKVAEGAKEGDIVYVALSSQPAHDVTIVPAGDAQILVKDDPIVLTSTKWKEPVAITVGAVDDKDVEGDHEGAMTFKLTSTDPGYATLGIAGITVAITDNDSDSDVPTDDTGGDEDEDAQDEEETARPPRAAVPPVAPRPTTAPRQPSVDRRTKAGAGRTPEGRTRTPESLGAGNASGRTDEEAKGRSLGGEITAAKEPEAKVEEEPTRVDDLLKWIADNWQLWAPLLAIGLIVAGAGAYLLRGDPVKAAQRAAGGRGAAGAARGARAGKSAADVGAKKGRRMRLRGMRRKGDDEEEDVESPPEGS